MLCFFLLLFCAGGLSSLIPAREIVKIIGLLFAIPIILYISVKGSLDPSVWTMSEDAIHVQFKGKRVSYLFTDIKLIRNLTRSGGSLYVLTFHKKQTIRYWRNKLFQGEDDSQALQQALQDSPIEFYKF